MKKIIRTISISEYIDNYFKQKKENTGASISSMIVLILSEYIDRNPLKNIEESNKLKVMSKQR